MRDYGYQTRALEVEKSKRRNHERIDLGGFRLHVYRDAGEEVAGTEKWVVWLNTEIADHDGICLAVEHSRDKAVGEAVRALELAAEQLNGPPRTAPS